jgi:transcriptional regulator with XRE-family HTH domain
MKLSIEKIRNELERTGNTPAWLARKMGSKPQWIDQILSGNGGTHTLRTIEKIARALGMDPKDLIK